MIDKNRITDYYVVPQRLAVPLPGGERFIAKVKVSFGDENVPHMELPFEARGITQAEAEQRAEAMYQKWLRSNEPDSK